MGVNKIEINYDNGNGIEVRVNDNRATLQDLLDAWQPLCDDERLYKLYAQNQHMACRGCTVNCCNTAYVIPDLIAFKKMAKYTGLDYPGFIARYFQEDKLKVGLLRMQPDPCIFLQDNICTIYPLRSLICRFYLCCKVAGDTEQLIYSLSWTGATATQLFVEELGLLTGSSEQGLSSFDIMFKKLIEDYRYDPNVKLFMQAGEYSDIPLAPFMVTGGRGC
ncbi:MAG: YkgJ family cysteine cluster protein [Syntrophomonadaceae bacterium]|nr:YkgJ family cysteine cluster protein [Syntrophomonadaceae bacterium]